MSTPGIITTHVYPPIPVRCMDWSAHFDGDDDEDRIAGWGATEAEAIADLKALVEVAEEDAEEERRNNGQFGVGA